MHHFHYLDGALYCENVPVAAIADAVGTPFYLYSSATLEHHFQVFDQAFAGISHLVCFAVKSNSNLAILRIFINQGSGVDIVSGGELYRALQAGVDPGKVVYSGVGKRPDEIRFALDNDILIFNIESPQEMHVLNQIAGELGKKARIALRVNPDVDPQTHPYISTGLKQNKFGINIDKSQAAYKVARNLANLEIVGVACHIGSQLTQLSPFLETLDRLKELIARLRQEQIDIRYLDIGGGLGIQYNQETPPHPTDYGRGIMQKLEGMDCTLILEPGRVLVGNAGILVTKVLYTKEGEDKFFIIVDAGMNDLSRPSLYGSYHGLQPVSEKNRREVKASLVGPICESGDFLAKDRMMPAFEPGELVAVMSAGAYGFTMSSNYNSRPRIPEILVHKDEFYVIRERETYTDMIRGEKVPDFLRAG
jgi:diaminopimelate decarboxylase